MTRETDFDPFKSIRNKKISELNKDEFDLAKELWIRENLGHLVQDEESRKFIQFLIQRIDDIRAELRDAWANS